MYELNEVKEIDRTKIVHQNNCWHSENLEPRIFESRAEATSFRQLMKIHTTMDMSAQNMYMNEMTAISTQPMSESLKPIYYSRVLIND